MPPKKPSVAGASTKRPRSTAKGKEKAQQSQEEVERHYVDDKETMFFNSPLSLKKFREEYQEKDVIKPRYVLRNTLVGLGFHRILAALDKGNWWPFLEMHTDHVNDLFIRGFYCLFGELREGGYKATLNGEGFQFNLNDVHTMTGLSMEGDEHLPSIDEVAFFHEIGVSYPSTGRRPSTKNMPKDIRVLLYIVTYIITPRNHSYTTMSAKDGKVIYAILKEHPMNWCKFILNEMISTKSNDKPLPYPFFILTLLQKAEYVTKVGYPLKPTSYWNITADTFRGYLAGVEGEEHEDAGARPPPPIKPSLSSIANAITDMNINVCNLNERFLHLNNKVDNMYSKVDEMQTFMVSHWNFTPTVAREGDPLFEDMMQQDKEHEIFGTSGGNEEAQNEEGGDDA